MGQEFHVVRCYTCLTFQTHIVKKSKKWECKMCGEKQSLRKVYGQGTGKECRIHTQKLNELRSKKEEIPLNSCCPESYQSQPRYSVLENHTGEKSNIYLKESQFLNEDSVLDDYRSKNIRKSEFTKNEELHLGKKVKLNPITDQNFFEENGFNNEDSLNATLQWNTQILQKTDVVPLSHRSVQANSRTYVNTLLDNKSINSKWSKYLQETKPLNLGNNYGQNKKDRKLSEVNITDNKFVSYESNDKTRSIDLYKENELLEENYINVMQDQSTFAKCNANRTKNENKRFGLLSNENVTFNPNIIDESKLTYSLPKNIEKLNSNQEKPGTTGNLTSIGFIPFINNDQKEEAYNGESIFEQYNDDDFEINL